MKRHVVIVALMTALTLGVASTSFAAPITGGIMFGGDGDPVGDTEWADSTGVDFDNPWLVVGGFGDYDGLFAEEATFTNLNWGAGSGDVNVPLAGNIWTLTVGTTTYTMTGSSVTNIDRADDPADNDGILVVGLGTLTITGPGTNFDPTPGDWSFSAGFTTGSRVPNLSFSAGAAGGDQDEVAPEPTSLMLLGTSLVGALVGLRRRQRQR